MMTYCTTSKDKVKKHGEVFTPAGTVFEMVMRSEVRDVLTDVDKLIFDPAIGQGQFPCAELVLKLFYNLDRLDDELALRALKSLYGMDIQSVNVDRTRVHLLYTIKAAYKFFTGRDFEKIDEAIWIIRRNIIVGDSLEFMSEMAARKQGLLFT